MKKNVILSFLCLITLNCKDVNSKERPSNKYTVSHSGEHENEENKNNNTMENINNKIQFYQLFPEDADIKFSPKDLEKTTDDNLIIFKKKLIKYENDDPTIEGLDIDNLSIFINNETNPESKSYVNSLWLEYFLNKYDLHYAYNDLMKTAIEQEDYSAVNILIKKGYIFRKEEVEIAEEIKNNAIVNIKNKKNNEGLDEKGDIIMYEDSKSKFSEILELVSRKYNRNKILDKDGYTNLRDGSYKSANVIEKIKSGEHIFILDNPERVLETKEDEEGFNWYLIQTKDGKKGYIHKSRIVSE